jgi:hypothetical protein
MEVFMTYVSIFDAKVNVSIDEINKERESWYEKGRNKIFQKRCQRIERFEVAGKSPQRIIFVIETKDHHALNILSHHFGDHWVSVSYPALKREIHEAMEEDKSIIGG